MFTIAHYDAEGNEDPAIRLVYILYLGENLDTFNLTFIVTVTFTITQYGIESTGERRTVMLFASTFNLK